jgi:hypothetical protein
VGFRHLTGFTDDADAGAPNLEGLIAVLRGRCDAEHAQSGCHRAKRLRHPLPGTNNCGATGCEVPMWHGFTGGWNRQAALTGPGCNNADGSGYLADVIDGVGTSAPRSR